MSSQVSLSTGTFARRFAATAVSAAVLSLSLMVGAASPSSATSTTSTAPTPPDLFVAYAPLIAQGSTPGANAVEAFDTSRIVAHPTTASLGSAQVGAQPVAEVVSPDGGTVYVLNSASDNITPVSTFTSISNPPQPEAAIALPSGYVPSAIALTPDGTDAYVVGYPVITNSLTPEMWEISLTGASPGTLARTVLLPPSASPAGIALTPSGATALITDYSGGQVLPVNLATGKVGTPIAVDKGPIGIAVSPNGNNAYVANSESGTLTQIDLSNDTAASPSTPLEVGYAPQQVAIGPDGSTAWVTEDNASIPGNAGFVVPVAIPTMVAASPIGVGFDPNGVGVSPDGSAVYVANETNRYGVGNTAGSISVINTGDGSTSMMLTSIDPAAVVVTPDEAPVASFVSHVAKVGQATCFDASASHSLTSGGLVYAWDFGDGTVSPPPTAADGYNQLTCHTFLLPGAYRVTLSVTDASGTSTAVIFTGQYVSNNGGPSAGQTSVITVPGATVNRGAVAYVANSQSNDVTPVLADPSQAVLPNVAGDPIPVGVHPSAIAITPDGATAYVVNFGSDNVTPINTSTNTAAPSAGWIPVGSEPNAIAISPDGTTAYVTNSGDGTISKIALSTQQVVATINVGGSPSGVAVSTDGTTAYVTNNNPGYENVIPVRLSDDSVMPGIPAGTDPVAIAVTPDGHAAFVVDRGSNIVHGAITPIDLTGAPTAGASFAVGNDPSAIAISSDGSYVYVTNSTDGTLNQITLMSDVLGTMTTSNAGPNPAGVAVNPDISGAYVANDVAGVAVTSGAIQMLTLPTTAGVPTPIDVGIAPVAVAITPDQAPVAQLSVSAAPATQATAFDASQTTFPSSGGASYSWSFGDGSPTVTTTTPTTTHVYATGGDFNASVTVTTTDGTSTHTSFTGQTVSLNGGSSASAHQVAHIPYLLPQVTGVVPTTGQAGEVTSLIVTGTNLFGISTVSVGGTSVGTFTVNAAGTQISDVLAPAAPAGSVDVTATNPAGTSPVTPEDVFTYLPTVTPPPSVPTVTDLSVHFGPVAGGSGVTITGENLQGATTVMFGSVPATNFSVNASGTEATAVAPAAASAGTVDVTVTTPTGTSAITSSDAFSYLAPPAPPATPVVAGISPNLGPTSGLTSVTITGENLLGATSVSFGAAPAQSFFASSPTTITAVSPAVVSAGTVDVTVTTGAGTSVVVPADAFTYEDGSVSSGPVVTSLTPSSGPESGGTTVVIAGSNFVSLSPSSVHFGSLTAVFSVNSAGTQITASAPAAATPESVDVVVSNPLGASTITPSDVYTYQPDAQFAPTITSLSPPSGPQIGGTTVTLVGTGFATVTEVDFGATATTNFTVTGSGTQIFVNAPSAATAGTVSVTAISPDGTSALSPASAFTYLPTSPPVTGPQVAAVSPVEGSSAGGTGVVITGTGFTGATGVDFGSSPAAFFTVDPSGTQIVATSPAGSPGSVDVTVTVTPAVGPVEVSPVVTLDVFTYVNALAAPSPTVTSMSLNSGPLTGGTTVTVNGANLGGALSVEFGSTPGTGIVVNPSGTSLTVTSPPALYIGTVTVVVSTNAGQSAPSSASQFTYYAVPSRLHAVGHVRLLDTRLPSGGGSFHGGEMRSLTIAGTNGVPVGASGVLVNLTITDATSSTAVTVFPAGSTQPSVPSSIASRGQTVAHLEELPLGAGGAISIYNRSGSDHVVVDLEGYFTVGNSGAGGVVLVSPLTVVNTAAVHGGGPVAAAAPRKVTLTGLAGVPKTGVSAVLFRLTSSGSNLASFATVYPVGSAPPATSSLNWVKGQVTSNLVLAKVGALGAVMLRNQYGTANFTVTVLGYVSAGAPHPGYFVTPSSSSKLLDTSTTGGPIGPGATRTFIVAGAGGVPASAKFVVLNVIVTSSTANSSIYLWAAGSAKPLLAAVTCPKGQSVSALVVVPIGAAGKVAVANQYGKVNVVISVQGSGQ